MRRLEKLSIRSFLFRFKTMEMQRLGAEGGERYEFIPGKMFSLIKSDFCRVLLESKGQILNHDDLFNFGKKPFVTSYLQN